MKYLSNLKSEMLDFSENNDVFSIGKQELVMEHGIKCNIRKLKICDQAIPIPEDFCIVYMNSRKKSDIYHSSGDYVYFDDLPYWNFNNDLNNKDIEITLTIINRNPKILDEEKLTPKPKYTISAICRHSDIYNNIMASGCGYISINVRNKKVTKCRYWFSTPNLDDRRKAAYGEGDYVDYLHQQKYININPNWNNVKGE